MRAHVGTSGFSYSEWKGRFYPEDLAASKMLAFYATRFSAVEINSSFYRMPKGEQLAKWCKQVPVKFEFALKASQLITHIKRLGDIAQPLSHFLEQADAMGTQLGPLLFQLPPNFKKDPERLRKALSLLPKPYRAAFEFRHESWFDDETYDVLRQHGAALCIADDEKLSTPFVTTAPFGYLRLRKPSYDEKTLAQFAKQTLAAKWRTAYVFFKHEDEARGPALAERFVKRLG